MNTVNKITTDLMCYINRVSMKEGTKFTKLITKYLENNGPEWTVNRLKSIYTAALHLKNDCPNKAMDVYRASSISYTKAGYPKDPLLGVIVRRFVESRSNRAIKRNVVPLRAYTAIVNDKVTCNQVEKAVQTISGPRINSKSTDPVETMCSQIEGLLSRKRFPNPKVAPFTELSDLRPFTACYSPLIPKGIPREIKAKPYFKSLYSLMTTTYYPSMLGNTIRSIENNDRNVDFHATIGGVRHDKKDIPGKIHIIQEGGCKGRTVAIPNGWTQLAFHPLHRSLSDYTERYFSKWSCVKDQTKGILSVVKHMQEGKTCHSIDLSAATDRFPLELQLQVLRSIGLPMYADALVELCSKEWDFPQGRQFGVNTVKYNVGQPMGLYGSFPLFNLTHIVFALACERYVIKKHGKGSLSRFEDGSSFKIIGDDFVCSDTKLANQYSHALVACGVEISPSKTFSGKVNEFAGYLAVPSNNPNGVLAFRPYKWPTENYITNPIDFLDSVGMNQRLSKKWLEKAALYLRTVHKRRLDKTPIVPMSLTREGVTGTLSTPEVASLFNLIISFSADEFRGSSKKDWFCKLPMVEESAYGRPSLGRSLGKTGLTPSPLAEERSPEIPKYEPTRRFNQDPLVKEEKRYHNSLPVIDPSFDELFTSRVRSVDSSQLNQGTHGKVKRKPNQPT